MKVLINWPGRFGLPHFDPWSCPPFGREHGHSTHRVACADFQRLCKSNAIRAALILKSEITLLILLIGGDRSQAAFAKNSALVTRRLATVYRSI